MNSQGSGKVTGLAANGLPWGTAPDCARAGLYEVRPTDFRAIPSAWGFLLAMAKCTEGSIVLILGPERQAPFGVGYGPGLQAFGLNPARLVIVRTNKSKDALWAMEEALRAGVGAVIGDRPRELDLNTSRRLHLAAEKSSSAIFQLRAPEDAIPSPALSRWRVAPLPPSRDHFGFIAGPRWHVVLERARGGRTGEWIAELEHGTLCLRIPSLLGTGTAQEYAA